VLGALALASACSGGSDSPRALPTLTATTTPSASPVVVPSAAKAHTPFGAAAFVRFYYGQLNLALQQADQGPLVGLSDAACGTCERYLASVTDLRRENRHLQGEAIRVISAEAPPEQNGYVAVDVFLDAPARAYVDVSGRVVKQLPAEAAAHKTVFVKRVPLGWTVRAVQDAK